MANRQMVGALITAGGQLARGCVARAELRELVATVARMDAARGEDLGGLVETLADEGGLLGPAEFEMLCQAVFDVHMERREKVDRAWVAIANSRLLR